MLRPMRPTSRGARVLSLAVLAGLLLAVLLPMAGANAASYRFWGYYQLKGNSWEFASKGPADLTPKDGAVEGWRFAVGDGATPRVPRDVLTFDELCGDTTAESGKKRVGVVLDYGRKVDGGPTAAPPAPVGKCAVVDDAASAAEVLAAVSSPRVEKGLVCAIDSYPATGCGGEVKTVSAQAKAADKPVTISTGSTGSTDTADNSNDATAAASAQSTDSEEGSSTGTWIGVGVVAALLLALGGLVMARRRQA